jgi:hypothetical protein
MPRPHLDYTPTSQMPQRDVRPIPGALEWIAEHCEEYAGRWIAVGPNGLVAAADTFRELEKQLDSLENVLISHVV